MSISLSIPIGSWSPFLRAALGSLKQQNDDLEIAVLIANDDPRIQAELDYSGLRFAYTRIGPDKGQAAAIAEGWANTSSPILTWLNTDDALTVGSVSSVRTKFERNSDLDLVYGNSTITMNNCHIVGLHPAVEKMSDQILRTNIVSQPSCFYRRKAVEDVGGINANKHYTMDWDLWIRLFKAQKKFEYVDDIYSNVTWEQGTKTSSLNFSRLKELAQVLSETQSFYKTAVGVGSSIWHDRKSYASEESLVSYARPIMLTPTSLSFPVLNMHRESKKQLHILHENDIQELQTNVNTTRVNRKTNKTTFIFENEVLPGETIFLTHKSTANSNSVLKSICWA